jgi:hypothetical protein
MGAAAPPLRAEKREENPLTPEPASLPSVNARLADAGETGEMLEMILVVRGTVRPTGVPGRWRVRLDGGGILTFDARCVVAATSLGRRRR